MSTRHNLAAQPREIMGKQVKRLRNQGFSIASVSTQEGTSTALQLDTKELQHLLQEAGESALLYLQVAGEKAERPVLIEEVQFHPVSGDILHLQFKQVNLKEKVTAEVPVEMTGEFKVSGGVLLTMKDAVEVEALPTDLPEKFVIDVSGLKEIGETITLAELTFDKEKVALVLDEEQTPESVTLVMVQEVKEEVEEAPVEPAEGETPAAEAAPAAEAPAEPAKE
ncbi:MAG TPA: 50S ribosomal protein L25 [Patescibacteria group bacterium]